MLGRMSVMRKRVEEAERNSRRQKKGWFWRRRRKKDDDRKRRRDDYYDDDYYDDRPRRRHYDDYDYYDDDYYGNQGYDGYYDDYGADYYGDEGEEYPDDYFGDEDEDNGPEGKSDFIPKNSAKNPANSRDPSVPEVKAPPKDDASDRDMRDNGPGGIDPRSQMFYKQEDRAERRAPERQDGPRLERRGARDFEATTETKLSKKEGKKDAKPPVSLDNNRSRRKVLEGLRAFHSDDRKIRRSRHGNHASQDSWTAEDLEEGWRGLQKKSVSNSNSKIKETKVLAKAESRQSASVKDHDESNILDYALKREAKEEEKEAKHEEKEAKREEVWSFSVPFNADVSKSSETASGKKHHTHKKPSDSRKAEQKEMWSFGETSKQSNLEAAKLTSRKGEEEAWNFGLPYTEKKRDAHKAEVAAGSEPKETTWSFSSPEAKSSKTGVEASSAKEEVWSFSGPQAEEETKGVRGEQPAGAKEQAWGFSNNQDNRPNGDKEAVWSFSTPMANEEEREGIRGEEPAGSREQAWTFSNTPHKEKSKDEEHAVWSFFNTFS